ncbi:MMPL family transporter [Methylosinus sp. H3A]|uniref:MMPL family transporter n=1 Tax=Methylosinus sp. H3A TaxID=2785786 RepID=UPI0018C2D6BA|nr:MMPL family transporter [Methylosinus sp. H3A]MBG0811100.1 MMPL family transporter [Methylosinus sp. H3A]
MLEKLVAWCLRRPWTVVIVTLALTVAGAYLTATRFAIDTDTAHLFSPEVPWRANETRLYKAFPQIDDIIVAVIDAKTGEQAEKSANALRDALTGKPLISRVWRPDDNQFFRDNGILFLGSEEIRRDMSSLVAQREFLQPLAEDPSLRGLSEALLFGMKQVGSSERGLAAFAKGLDSFTDAFDAVLAGKPAKVSWEKLLAGGREPEAPSIGPSAEPRRMVLIKPIIDYSALEPGHEAVQVIRDTAKSLGLVPAEGVTVRLTGQVPLADEEFATVAENTGLNVSATLAVVTLILWAALRSKRLIFAVLVTIIAGLAMTSGLGILLIGRFNLISVAFAVLFIGLGVDFGIQFATRYREERHNIDDLPKALLAATRGIGWSLTLAAVSLLAGFFCFLPTEFRGVAELGLIAGFGMIIAYLATLTFLPALIRILGPKAEATPVQTASLASVDHWIAGHRKLVLLATAAVVLAGAPFLLHLKFDSNPMNLRDQTVESVATFLDLSKNPQTAPNKIEVLAASVPAARELAKKIAALPEVDHVTTIDELIPAAQAQKLPLLENAANQLRKVLDPTLKPAPTDEDTKKALTRAAKTIRKAGVAPKAPPGLVRFADSLDALVKASPEIRKEAQTAALSDLDRLLGELRKALAVHEITPETLPADLRDEWISADGQVRVEVTPKGDSNDREVMTRFAEAVQTLAPDAGGPPVIVAEAGKTVVDAFLQAGVLAFVAIFLILVVALRRASDVALTLGPLVLAGIMSLEAADLLGISLNFANIIALPLMFGVGVAFHIYYVIAWRKGVSDMLASSLTRAIFFSALTTGTAFGSLFLSSHPGTASMGALLAISLFFTLLAAFIIVPAFLGPPRREQEEETQTEGVGASAQPASPVQPSRGVIGS